MVLRCDRRIFSPFFAVFERWRESENALFIRQQIQSLCAAEPLLSAFSLLT